MYDRKEEEERGKNHKDTGFHFTNHPVPPRAKLNTEVAIGKEVFVPQLKKSRAQMKLIHTLRINVTYVVYSVLS